MDAYRQKTLLEAAPTTQSGGVVPTLQLLALDAVAAHFPKRPTLAGVPPRLQAALSARLSASLDPAITMPVIVDERYWQRACEEGRGWHAVDIKQHGGSWRQAFAELYVAESLRKFGVYPDQPPGWDYQFLRPPIDSRHAQWAASHPQGPTERPDKWPGAKGKEEGERHLPWRERYSRSATEHRAWGWAGLAGFGMRWPAPPPTHHTLTTPHTPALYAQLTWMTE